VSGSVAEVQSLSDQILELLGVRMRAGQLVIHYSDGLVQRCETNTVHKPRARRVTDAPVDSGGSTGSQ
jgi:hypothetical protein